LFRIACWPLAKTFGHQPTSGVENSPFHRGESANVLGHLTARKKKHIFSELSVSQTKMVANTCLERLLRVDVSSKFIETLLGERRKTIKTYWDYWERTLAGDLMQRMGVKIEHWSHAAQAMFDKCNKFVHVYPKSRLIFLMSWCV
jgi:hypothetical protein